MADTEVFRVPGAPILFKLLSTASEMHAEGLQKYQHNKKKTMSFKGLLTKLAAGNMQDIANKAKAEAATRHVDTNEEGEKIQVCAKLTISDHFSIAS